MRTYELISQVHDLGFRIEDDADTLNISEWLGNRDLLAAVYTKIPYDFETYSSFKYLDEPQRTRLYKMLYEYSGTPVEKREKIRKFLICAPHTDKEYLYSKCLPLNTNKLAINHINNYKNRYNSEISRSYFEFTKQEIADFDLQECERWDVSE